jgi:hypothetical protein
MGLFGPSKTGVWRTLSERIGGTFVEGGELKGAMQLEPYFIERGAIKDLNQRKDLFNLFGEVLHRLTAIGVATEADPGIRI